jgi:hypothetical protein
MLAFAVPVAVPVGGLSPGDSLVVAGTEPAQQYGVEFGGLGDLRGLDGGVGLPQHVASFTGPGLLVGVQVENTLQVAEKVSHAFLDPGGLGVELVPAYVVSRTM